MQPNEDKPKNEVNMDERHFAVPLDVQLDLAENRKMLAEFRYELMIRRGRGWDVCIHENEQNA